MRPRRVIFPQFVTYLFNVEEVFWITGRGLVIIPGPWPQDSKARIKVGNLIEIRRPDGSTVASQITGVELAKQAKGPCCLALVLNQQITQDDVPKSSEIWLVSPQQAAQEP